MKLNKKININKSSKSIKKNKLEASNYFDSLRKKINKNKKEKKLIYKNKKHSISVDSKKKQRNSICLIGFPEYAYSSFDSIYENIIKPNKAFVFAHIWSNGYVGVIPKVEGLLKSVGAIYHIQPQDREKYDVSFVKGCWYNQRKAGPLSFPPNVFGQFDSARRVMKLVKNYEKINGKFQWVFKSRFDMHFMHPIIMNNYKNSDRVLDQIHARPIPYPWMFQDFAFFGTSNSMHLWGDCFNSIKKIYTKNGAAFNQESIWSKNWELNNIKIFPHPEWDFHITKKSDGCLFCRSVPHEPKPYNAKNPSNDKWELK